MRAGSIIVDFPGVALALHPRLSPSAPSAQPGVWPFFRSLGARELRAAPLQGLLARKTERGGGMLATPVCAFGAAGMLATPNSLRHTSAASSGREPLLSIFLGLRSRSTPGAVLLRLRRSGEFGHFSSRWGHGSRKQLPSRSNG